MTQNYEIYEQFGIYELRKIARQKGVASPTKLRKKDLIEQITKIDSGEILPKANPINRGRPVKFINLPSENITCFGRPAFKILKEIYDLVFEHILNKKS